jgi:glutamate-1-semialdehyde 2,1-aminomutase
VSEIDRPRLRELIDRERRTYADTHPRSRELAGAAQHLFGGVPMTWMAKWSGGFPLHLAAARGNRVTDVDGHDYLDLALGDTGAMAGHSPQPTVDAVARRIGELGGVTTMLPTADAEWVGAELTARFGLPLWSFTLSATDANRWAIRVARLVTGRPKVLTFAYCYHGTVDEAFAVRGPDGTAVARPGNVGAPVPVDATTRVAEFNDLASVEEQLAHGDVAVVLTEPALTNIGIVLPEPGFLEGLRELCTRYGTLLLIDETHTFSTGPGGATAAWGLQPDLFVIGKSIGGGVPCGAYGLTEDVARRVAEHPEADLVDVGGVGGTLAGNALSVAAMRATLEQVLTPAAFAGMVAAATRYTEGVATTIERAGLPWSIAQLGARAEYRFTAPAPRNGTESAAAADDELDEFFHLYLLNRGVMITPFHNMALMAPGTRDEDVDRHTELFAAAVDELLAG